MENPIKQKNGIALYEDGSTTITRAKLAKLLNIAPNAIAKHLKRNYPNLDTSNGVDELTVELTTKYYANQARPTSITNEAKELLGKFQEIGVRAFHYSLLDTPYDSVISPLSKPQPTTLIEDFSINENGEAFISQRKTAQLLGVNLSAIQQRLEVVTFVPNKNNKLTSDSSSEVVTFVPNKNNQLSEDVLVEVATYYAMDSNSATKEAKELVKRLTKAGARAFIYQAAGVSLTPTPTPTNEIVNALNKQQDTLEALQVHLGFSVNETMRSKPKWNPKVYKMLNHLFTHFREVDATITHLLSKRANNNVTRMHYMRDASRSLDNLLKDLRVVMFEIETTGPAWWSNADRYKHLRSFMHELPEHYLKALYNKYLESYNELEEEVKVKVDAKLADINQHHPEYVQNILNLEEE